MELTEKIETALVNYLSAQTWPAYFDLTMILPGEADELKTGQLIQIICEDATDEDPQFTGNFWHPVNLEIRSPMSVATDAETVAEAQTQLAKHKEIAAVLETAIMVDDLPDQLSGFAVGFTCIGLVDRRPTRSQGEDFWSSGFDFRVYACSSSL